MKKIALIALSVIIAAVFTAEVYARSADADPKNLGSGISLYPGTLKKKFFESTAVFKIDYPDTEEIDDVKVAYETVHAKAYCRKKVLEFVYFSYFDDDDKWLYGYKNEKAVGAHYGAYNNGKIFFKALCGR